MTALLCALPQECDPYETEHSRSAVSIFFRLVLHVIHICRTDIEQVHGLIQKLQRIAKDAGHERPLMIGIDQENGDSKAVFTIKPKC